MPALGIGDLIEAGMYKKTILFARDGTDLLTTAITQGDVNNAAAIAGAVDTVPIARYNATLPTLTDTRYNMLQVGTRGGLHVDLYDTNGIGTLFPTTAATADALANPTVTQIGALSEGFNGTTWDRLRSGAVSNVAAATGYLDALAVAVYNATLPTLTDTRFSSLQLGSRGALQVNILDKDGTGGTFPTAAASADALANPTISQIGADMMGFNGTTWDRLQETSGFLKIQGTVATAVTTANNPMTIGMRDTAGGSGATNGTQTIPICDTSGDASTDGYRRIYVWAAGALWNNATWDRARNNYEVTLLASAARTTTQTGADQTNYDSSKMIIVIDVTAGAAAPGLTPAVQGKDTLSGKYYQLHAAFTQITAIGTTVYEFAVGAGVAAGGITAVASVALPRIWRLVVTVADTTSYTYSASVNYIK